MSLGTPFSGDSALTLYSCMLRMADRIINVTNANCDLLNVSWQGLTLVSLLFPLAND